MATISEKDKIIKLSTAEYTTLSTTGTLTKDGVTYTYSPSDTIYVTPDAISGLSEYKEQLRLICNRYLDQQDRLPIDCTWEELIAVFNEYDEYSYMNAFLNSIEVFPDKDYSINDTEGHIKGLRQYAFYNNTAVKSIILPNCGRVGTDAFRYTSGLELLDIHATSIENSTFLNSMKTGGKIILRGIANLGKGFSGDYGGNPTNAARIIAKDVTNWSGNSLMEGCVSLQHFSLPNLSTMSANYTVFKNNGQLKSLLFKQGTFNNSAWFEGSAVGVGDALILLGNCTIAGTTWLNNFLTTTFIVYVPSSLLSTYQSATNWTTINDTRPIQDIESHINYLRNDIGVDFSFTPYANKKWDSENNQLITDNTIGEEADE